jgi:hypothetical protein
LKDAPSRQRAKAGRITFANRAKWLTFKRRVVAQFLTAFDNVHSHLSF